MSESAGEKSFAPSAKRKADAAKKGDVVRSREGATAVAILIGAAWLQFAGPWVMDTFDTALRSAFVWDRSALEEFEPGRMMTALALVALPPVFILGLAVMLASVVSQLSLGEGRWLPGNLAPKWSRVDPAAGLKRMFGPTGWIEMGKGLLKVGLLGAIAWAWAGGRLVALVALGRAPLSTQLQAGWDAIVSLLFALAAGLAVIAVIDLPVQLIRRLMRLRMTLEEVKDEAKESEGSPERKGMIRQRQRQIAMGSVAQAMREAQFLITNPTHFAVAVAYDPAKAPAPVVLARGRGEKALAMRELAAEHGLPVLEYPALARSVYYTTRERQMIREELYAAVAAVLAFVMSIRRGEHPERPEVDVPVTLRFDVDGRPDATAARA